MGKYLDATGLSHLWDKIKSYIASYVEENAVDKSYYSGSNAVTTLTGIPVDKKLVVATVSAGGTLTLSDAMEDGGELHIIINNSSSSAITVTLPDDSTLEIAGSGYGEVNILYAGGTYYYKSA